MGGRQSKRSVDISGTPKKGELENGAVEEGRLERIEESDVAPKVAINGTAPHSDKEASSPVSQVSEQTHAHYPTTGILSNPGLILTKTIINRALKIYIYFL